MTRKEFSEVMAFLATAIQKPMTKDMVAVYFELLGDLPVEVFRISAKRVVLEHKWATFPSVAELREAASETMRGQVKELSPAEAWDLAWKAARRHDPDVRGEYVSNGKNYPSQWAALAATLPPLVAEAISSYGGVLALCKGKEPVGVVRGHFLKIYEQLAARERRQALLPPALKKQIAEHRGLAAPVRNMIADVGKEST